MSAVSRIALVSPERSKQIETILLRMAQSGQLRGRVTEEQLIDLLNQASPFHVLKTEARVKLIGLHRWRRLKGNQDLRNQPLWCVDSVL